MSILGSKVGDQQFNIRIDQRDMERLRRFMVRFQGKQTRLGQAYVLTGLAKSSKSLAYDKFRTVFDQPTPYTMRSLFSTKATKDTLTAWVGFREGFGKGNVPAWKYLGPQIVGGGRAAKRLERALYHAGYLGPREFVVPGKSARLDRYGNLRGGQVVQILAYLRAFQETGFNMNRTTDPTRAKRSRNRTKAYFVPRPNSPLARGVYQRTSPRHGARIKSIMHFTSKPPTYRIRMPWVETLLHRIESRAIRYWTHVLRGQR